MPEELGQAPTGNNPAGGDPAASAQGQAPHVDDELRRARDEAAKHRVAAKEAKDALKEAQDAIKARDDADKSELQKAIDKANELEGKLSLADKRTRKLALENAVAMKASKLNIVDPDAAVRLMDADKVEYDDNGKPQNIDDLLQALIAERPYLVKEDPKPSARKVSPGSPAAPNADNGGKGLTLEDIQGMSDSEVNARWDDVQKVLAASKK